MKEEILNADNLLEDATSGPKNAKLDRLNASKWHKDDQLKLQPWGSQVTNYKIIEYCWWGPGLE